jgi:hypothetical protein
MWKQWHMKSKFSHIYLIYFRKSLTDFTFLQTEQVPNPCTNEPKKLKQQALAPLVFFNHNKLLIPNNSALILWFATLDSTTILWFDPTVEPPTQSWQPWFWEDFYSCKSRRMSNNEYPRSSLGRWKTIYLPGSIISAAICSLLLDREYFDSCCDM